MKKTKTKKKKFKDSSSSGITDLQSSDFHKAVTKIAVAQICKSIGFKGAQTTVLETLTDIAVRYLQSIAKSAATSAVSTGRTQCNLLDVIRAFEGLHSDLGFKGNSDPKKRLYILSNSSILRDTMKFVYRSREIPFAKPLPRGGSTIPSISTFSGQCVKLNHIPRWLPDFPKISDGGGKTVADTANEGEIEMKKKMCLIESDWKISKLPEKRKKVSFKISGGGGRNEIEVKFGGDLRSGVCKGGKRILCEIYDDDDDDDDGKPCSIQRKHR